MGVQPGTLLWYVAMNGTAKLQAPDDHVLILVCLVLVQYPRPDLPRGSAHVAARTTLRKCLCLRNRRLPVRHFVVLCLGLCG